MSSDFFVTYLPDRSALCAVPVVLSAAVVMAPSDWAATSGGVVLWVMYALLFAYASGVRPRWMTFLIHSESFGGLALFVRTWAVIVPLFSVARPWWNRYFPDPFAGLIERDLDLVREPGAIGHELFWTMSPFVFVPWLVFFVYQHSAKLNALVRGRGLRMLALVGGAAGVTVLGVGGIIWSVFYCYRRSLDAPGLLQKILWGTWPGALGFVGVGVFVFGAVRHLRRTLSDYKYLRPTKDLPDIITRSRVADVWRSLKLAQSRRLFVERLVSIRKVEGEWPGAPPYTGNDWASAELARLDERWRGWNADSRRRVRRAHAEPGSSWLDVTVSSRPCSRCNGL